jgi:arsenate reductase-like glutaredoxin family protein
VLLNRKGTTWRKLDTALQNGVVDAVSAAVLMQAHASVIKRPVVQWPDGRITLGFAPQSFAQLLP